MGRSIGGRDGVHDMVKAKRTMMGMTHTMDDTAARRIGTRWMGIALAALLLALALGMHTSGAAFAKEEVAVAAPQIDISIVLDGPAIVVPAGEPAAACGAATAVPFSLASAPAQPEAALGAGATTGTIDAGSVPAHPGCAAKIAS